MASQEAGLVVESECIVATDQSHLWSFLRRLPDNMIVLRDGLWPSRCSVFLFGSNAEELPSCWSLPTPMEIRARTSSLPCVPSTWWKRITLSNTTSRPSWIRRVILSCASLMRKRAVKPWLDLDSGTERSRETFERPWPSTNRIWRRSKLHKYGCDLRSIWDCQWCLRGYGCWLGRTTIPDGCRHPASQTGM